MADLPSPTFPPFSSSLSSPPSLDSMCPDVIYHIIQFLNYRDKKMVREVSSGLKERVESCGDKSVFYWRLTDELMIKFVDDVKKILGVEVKDASDNGVEYLLKKHPELVKFQLGKRVKFEGERVKAIYFTLAGLDTLLSMPGLTSLSILSRIDINPANVTKIMSKQLQTLDLSGITDIDDAYFLHIVEQCGKTLKFLNLSFSQISGDKLADCNGALSCLDTLELQECDRLTVSGLNQIFKSCGKTLRSLNLSGIFGEFFLSFVEYSGTLTCLENLNLSHCQITDRGLVQIFKVCGKTLRSMDLSYTDITGEILVEYSRTLACLENLDLSSCEHITNEGLIQIFTVCDRTLRSLNLDSTYVTGESLVGYSGTLACLETLNCSFSQITDEGLVQIFKVCGTTLRSLDLCSTYITGESFVEYSGTLVCLENLDLSYCEQITDEGLIQIFKVCDRTLRSLKLVSTYVTGESLVEYSGTLACLETLNGRSSQITERGLLQIFKVCGTTLRSLDLSYTDITGESLVEYSGTLACLETLNGSNTQINDIGLLQIFKVCGTTLRSLDLSNTRVTGEILVEYSGTLACLETLNLQLCKITDRGLVKIIQHFGKTLRYLKLYGTCIKEENLLKYKKMGLLLDSDTVYLINR